VEQVKLLGFQMIKLLFYNIRMRIIDWCNKPEVIELSGWDWVERIGKL
jgi:hypothetical protein